MKYCLVTQHLEKVLPDLPGSEDEVTGKVRFTPSIPRGGSFQVDTDEGAVTVPASSVEADIVAGILTHEGVPGVRLFAGGENSNPQKVVWRAEYLDLRVGGHRVYLGPVPFMAVPEGVVDLTTVTPVTGMSPSGVTRGKPGSDGLTPRIEGGTWWIGDTDTGVPSQGPQGDDGVAPEIIDGTWWIGGIDTGTPATGPQGSDGLTPRIEDGIWWVGDTNTEVAAEGLDGDDGQDGFTPHIVDGKWWIGDQDTGVPATGEKGDTGKAPPRTPRILIYSGTDTPDLTNFPDAQVGDYIVRKTDGQEWKVEA